jgi:hypothetical protein
MASRFEAMAAATAAAEGAGALFCPHCLHNHAVGTKCECGHIRQAEDAFPAADKLPRPPLVFVDSPFDFRCVASGGTVPPSTLAD